MCACLDVYNTWLHAVCTLVSTCVGNMHMRVLIEFTYLNNSYVCVHVCVSSYVCFIKEGYLLHAKCRNCAGREMADKEGNTYR